MKFQKESPPVNVINRLEIASKDVDKIVQRIPSVIQPAADDDLPITPADPVGVTTRSLKSTAFVQSTTPTSITPPEPAGGELLLPTGRLSEPMGPQMLQLTSIPKMPPQPVQAQQPRASPLREEKISYFDAEFTKEIAKDSRPIIRDEKNSFDGFSYNEQDDDGECEEESKPTPVVSYDAKPKANRSWVLTINEIHF